MLNIIVTNVYSKIEYVVNSGLSSADYQTCMTDIYNKLSLFDKEAVKFSPRYNTFNSEGKRLWDGYTHFFSSTTNAFLTGLLPFVTPIIDKHNIKYNIIPKYTIPNVVPKLVTTVGSYKMRDYQVEGIKIALQKHRGIFDHSTSAGKGHPPNTPILTPTGWKEIEQLRIGDDVIAVDGTATKVTGVFPRGRQQTYEVIFNDRTSIICDSDHLWKTQKWKSKWKIISTKELVLQKKTLTYRCFQSRIPTCSPIQFTKKELTIDPYVLGVILGDGSIANITPVITTKDTEIIENIAKLYTVHPVTSPNRCPGYSIIGIYNKIKNLKLQRKRSWEKFVPKDYLLSTIDDRLALLQGLLDTDGTISKSGTTISFSSTSEQLVNDVAFLVRSLGGKAVIGKSRIPKYTYKKELRSGRRSYRVFLRIPNYTPFRLSSKVKRATIQIRNPFDLRKEIIDIKNTGYQNTICISIEHPSQLYVAKEFVVTHNTIMSLGITESIPVKTLFLVDREELLRQTYDKYRKNIKRSVGVITSKDFEPREITIGMIQTIYSHLKNKYTREETQEYLNTVNLAFFDECHKAASPTWRYVLSRLHYAYYRYGLSGTPILDNPIRNMYTMGLIGRIIHQVSYKYLIDNGYIAKPTINIVNHSPVHIPSSADYSEVYRTGIVENEDRNRKIVQCIKKHKDKSVLILVKQLDHGTRILDMLKSEDGFFISGQDTKADRISVYNRFSNKTIPIVIASLIYKEGIDIPAVDVLIYAVGEKAPVTILQSLGRGMRIRNDKKELICYDYNDDSHYHLKRHLKKRIKIYEEEGFLIKYIQNLEELGITNNE